MNDDTADRPKVTTDADSAENTYETIDDAIREIKRLRKLIKDFCLADLTYQEFLIIKSWDSLPRDGDEISNYVHPEMDPIMKEVCDGYKKAKKALEDEDNSITGQLNEKTR